MWHLSKSLRVSFLKFSSPAPQARSRGSIQFADSLKCFAYFLTSGAIIYLPLCPVPMLSGPLQQENVHVLKTCAPLCLASNGKDWPKGTYPLVICLASSPHSWLFEASVSCECNTHADTWMVCQRKSNSVHASEPQHNNPMASCAACLKI